MSSSKIDLPQGTLDLLILGTLALEPQHGWAISERIQQISSDVTLVSRVLFIPPYTAPNAAAGLRPDGAVRQTTLQSITNSPGQAASCSRSKTDLEKTRGRRFQNY